MNPYLIGAAVLLFAIGLGHSYLGERYILIRLFRRTDLPKIFGSETFTRRVLRFAWHITTVAWCGFAILLIAVARGASSTVPVTTVGAVVAMTFLVSAITSLVGSRGRHYSWVIFLAISALSWLGTH